MDVDDYKGYLLGYNISNYEEIPACMSNEFFKNFIRGFFDNHGVIDKKTFINNSLNCYMISRSNSQIIKKIKENINIKPSVYDESIGELSYSDKDALDFLHFIYHGSDARYRLEKNYRTYLKWISGGKSIPICKFSCNDSKAIKPVKNNICNISYEIYIIKKIQENGLISLYDTGVIIKPETGYYVRVVPDNSLLEKGYMVYNHTKENSKSIKLYLVKMNPNVPEITLPILACSIILEKKIYFEFEFDFDEEE